MAKYEYQTSSPSVGLIWAVGDSTTLGRGGTLGCGFRDYLYQSFVSRNPLFIGTIAGGDGVGTCPISGKALGSDGHVGFTCAQITSGVPGWYASLGYVPKVGLLCAGVNDIVAVVLATETMLQATTDFTATLSTVLSTAPFTTWVVSTLPPAPNYLGTVEPFNTHIANRVAIHAAAGARVSLVDGYSSMGSIAEPTPGADFDSGGIHPNNSGYSKWAVVWRQGIASIA